jgi:CheY-like chemotaxis protein
MPLGSSLCLKGVASSIVSMGFPDWRRRAVRGILEGHQGRIRDEKESEAGMGEIVMASIVLADDDDDLRALYTPLLRSAGHTVWEASGGVEALELVRKHRPGLLILDVWMPRCNGFEVLEALRHDPASNGLKVLMLSNLGDADTRLEAFEMGASEYLVKGLPLTDLRAKVGELLATTEDVKLDRKPEPEAVPPS